VNPKDYVQGVLVTESRDMADIATRATTVRTIRLLHAAMGLVTEAGEFLDAVKKHIFYGKEFDKTNLVEELGDLFWYIGIASDVLDRSFEEIMQINHNKLAARYGKGFSSQAANDRDLAKERKVLEEKE